MCTYVYVWRGCLSLNVQLALTSTSLWVCSPVSVGMWVQARLCGHGSVSVHMWNSVCLPPQ